MPDGQLAFDIDALIHEATVEAALPWHGAPLHFTVDYYPPADLDAAFAQWQFLNGAFASVPRSHMWHRSITGADGLELGGHRAVQFTADLRCLPDEREDSHPGCNCVGGLVTQLTCEPCEWHVIGADENDAVESWHDHAFHGWRDLPVVPARIRVRNERGLTKPAIEWIAEHYPARAQIPGAPIITERSPQTTRHVPGYSPWGGYDIARVPTQGQRREPRRGAVPQRNSAFEYPQHRAARERGRGLGD
ncbi:DUF6349 family protein [Leifsonia aquatica]|uniref:DUF6349 family protein n=1 Tax=Leifsonia aquatica TaxID=144185 RepID=UPI0028ACC9B5|nr:DUF6349 family protein [Leifsonia aquatica]